MIESKDPAMKCKFEPRGCDCDGHSLCTFCGWNPKVKAERVAILRQQQQQGNIPHLYSWMIRRPAIEGVVRLVKL